MKWQWQSMTKTQENNFSEFRERKHLVGKEVQNVMGTLQHLNFLAFTCYRRTLMKQTSCNPHSVLVHVLKMSMLSIEESSLFQTFT